MSTDAMRNALIEISRTTAWWRCVKIANDALSAEAERLGDLTPPWVDRDPLHAAPSDLRCGDIVEVQMRFGTTFIARVSVHDWHRRSGEHCWLHTDHSGGGKAIWKDPSQRNPAAIIRYRVIQRSVQLPATEDEA